MILENPSPADGLATGSSLGGAIPDAELDKPLALKIVEWEGRIHCAYLNDFRIAGGKPWAGGRTVKAWGDVTIRELARAIPALREALGLDYLGHPISRNNTPA